jgi:anti-anti-sigma factor
MEFGFTVRVGDDRTVIALSGELDTDSVADLRLALTRALDSTAVEIDMAQVTFMDSSGLRELIGAYKRREAAGGSLRIVEPSTRVERLLKLTGQYERFIDAGDSPA